MSTCETCKWWGGRVKGAVHYPAPCRRYPPTVVVRDRQNDLQQHWPTMTFAAFCGEHQSKDTNA